MKVSKEFRNHESRIATRSHTAASDPKTRRFLFMSIILAQYYKYTKIFQVRNWRAILLHNSCMQNPCAILFSLSHLSCIPVHFLAARANPALSLILLSAYIPRHCARVNFINYKLQTLLHKVSGTHSTPFETIYDLLSPNISRNNNLNSHSHKHKEILSRPAGTGQARHVRVPIPDNTHKHKHKH